MRITLVLRGDDHISNTPKQIVLYEALGAPLPRFGHLPLIHGMDGKKLSKRHGATAVDDYQHQGILAQSMVNFLALLGWSPGNDIEIMSVPQMIDLFSTEGLSKKSAIFDTQKLAWMNGQHLAAMPAVELAQLVRPAIVSARLATKDELSDRTEWLHSIIDLLKIRSRTVDDIVQQAQPYLRETIAYDADAVAKQWKDRPATAEVLSAVRETLSRLHAWEPDIMESALRSLADARGVGAGKLFQSLRVALTGSVASPGIFDVLKLLGRERSLARIDAGLNYVARNA